METCRTGWSGRVQGDAELVKFLVQEGNANVNLVVEDYHTAVSEACRIGALDIVRYLVEEAQASVDVRTESDDHISALAFACIGPSTGMLGLVKYLVEEANAVVDPPLMAGLCKSPLEIASSRGLQDIVKYLVEQGNADVNLQFWNIKYGSALASAVLAKRFDVIKYLVAEAHADVNLQLHFGLYCTALVAALSVGSRDMVQFLVEEGNANINLQFISGSNDNFGSTLEYAMIYSKKFGMDVLEYLVSHKTADVNIRHLQGPYANPLSRAICEEYAKGVQILLSAGASADFRWNSGSLLGVPNSSLKQVQYSGGGGAEVVDMLRKADPNRWNDEAIEQIP
ncbi:ankyrin repeat-containing domain protein [Aspergillus parasiticus]|uniref:Ankyrin repeat-containing domain protein n=1 Tax=Aspergillus parasiticus TaxID=5067 RepID=A0A5N6DU25_ASPPA|nr:ankyrin repeat-containing domain protein [Aspergillus parasiticus]